MRSDIIGESTADSSPTLLKTLLRWHKCAQWMSLLFYKQANNGNRVNLAELLSKPWCSAALNLLAAALEVSE